MSVTTRAIGAPLDLADGPDKVKGAAKERQSRPSVGSGDPAVGQRWHPDQTFCRAQQGAEARGP
jgi:hypothetical protein